QQFGRMVRYFESVGFKKSPGPATEPEDPEQILMSGTIAQANARKLLVDPHVKAVLLIPSDYQMPSGEQDLALVSLELVSTANLQVRERLAAQLRALLHTAVGLEEAVGYDNRGHNRILGSLPASKLQLLLEDLRAPATGSAPGANPMELVSPLRDDWPWVVTEVIPVPAGVPIRTPPPPEASVPAGQEYLGKMARDLRALTNQNTPQRVELVLAAAPSVDDRAWSESLASAAP